MTHASDPSTHKPVYLALRATPHAGGYGRERGVEAAQVVHQGAGVTHEELARGQTTSRAVVPVLLQMTESTHGDTHGEAQRQQWWM